MAELRLIRTSERTTHMRCAWRWRWSYLDGLKPVRSTVPLRFGDLVHQALAAYYKPGLKRGALPSQTFLNLYDEQAVENEGQYVEEQWEEARELGVVMLDGYVAHYGSDRSLEVIAAERPFQIDLHHPKTKKYLCTYVGTFDAVVRDVTTDQVGLLEHKTAAAIGSGDRYQFDEQPNSYWAFAQDWMRSKKILRRGQQLDFILMNILGKSFPDKRPTNELGQALNKDGSISKNQPAKRYFREKVFRSDEERRATMLRVIDQAWVMEQQRRGKIPIYKSILNGCTGMFGCEFRDLCMVHESGSDWEALRDAMFTTWDPYEAHDWSEEASKP